MAEPYLCVARGPPLPQLGNWVPGGEEQGWGMATGSQVPRRGGEAVWALASCGQLLLGFLCIEEKFL